MLETIASGITIFSFGKAVYNSVTGHLAPRKLDNIERQLGTLSSQIQELDQSIYYLSRQDVFDTRLQNQRTVDDLRVLTEAARPMQKALGTDLILSTPIQSPGPLQDAFQRNPEEVLWDIRPLEGQGLPEDYPNDPTSVPVVFSKWGQYFVGLMKIGYAQATLHLDYRGPRGPNLSGAPSPEPLVIPNPPYRTPERSGFTAPPQAPGTNEPLYQQRGGFFYSWPLWWFGIFSAGASWPFSSMKVFPDSIEIRTLRFFTNRYKREEISVRRWKLIPTLIDGIAISKAGSSGFRLFATFRAEKLLAELRRAGFSEG